MFAYLRYFAIISFLVVVCAAVGVGYYFRTIASNDMRVLVEDNNVALVQGYINATWRAHRPFLQALPNPVPISIKSDERFIQFTNQTFKYFEGIPVVKLNVYTPFGVRLLSTDQSEILVLDKGGASQPLGSEKSLAGFTAARKGQPYSQILNDTAYRRPDGSLKHGSLVQTFIPIIADSYVSVVAGANVKVEGVVEVFYDITPQSSKLARFQISGTLGIVVIFVVLLAALFFTSRRAETIIARQHEANLELTAAAARAEAENREKSQFLANISHELRTPLNAIIGFSEIIQNEMMGALGNPQYMDYVRDIHSSGKHLLSLINDILDYSKAEAGKLSLELAEVDATKLIISSMRLVSPRAEHAQVELVQSVPKEHFVLITDAKKLKQVLLNLFSNAVKFTPPGGTVTVTAWQRVGDNMLCIEVRDTGIGIAPKDISKAMAPFGQVDSELSRRYEGTGLGLPLAKKFIEVMGGKFHIESEVGKGTSVTIALPLELPAKLKGQAITAAQAA